MKKEVLVHSLSFLIFFVLVTLVRGWFDVAFIAFWVGGILGTILPDVDHLIYVYYLRPEEYDSQRTTHMAGNRNFVQSFKYLAETRDSRTRLIFHTVYFQLIFLALTLFVITSSGSLFGRGIVLAFSLHLLVDQVMDFMGIGNINNWFRNTPFQFSADKQKVYLTTMSVALLILGFLM